MEKENWNPATNEEFRRVLEATELDPGKVERRTKTENPIDIFCDLAGIPRDDSRFAEIRKYCDAIVPDGMGGEERRWSGRPIEAGEGSGNVTVDKTATTA